MTKEELKSLERDLLLIQRTRLELANKVKKMLEEVDGSSMVCLTLELLITDLRKKIDATPSIEKLEKGRSKV